MYWKPNWKTEFQTELSLQKNKKNKKNLQEIKKNHCSNKYMY